MATSDKVINCLKSYPENSLVPIIQIISYNTKMNIRANYTKAALKQMVASGILERVQSNDKLYFRLKQ